VVERLHLAGLGGDELGLGTRIADGLPRPCLLDLLDSLVRDEECDLLAL
jgi:hypothetical protein